MLGYTCHSSVIMSSEVLDQPSIKTQVEIAASIREVDFCYGSSLILKNINLEIELNKVTAFIGPSGCGKSTLLRCLNRMNDEIPRARVTKGKIFIQGEDIYDPRVDVARLRNEVGMVFQKSNAFPRSIFENVSYGLQSRGERNSKVRAESVEQALRAAGNQRRPDAAPEGFCPHACDRRTRGSRLHHAAPGRDLHRQAAGHQMEGDAGLPDGLRAG